jgi:hypothetical protein
MRISSWQDLPHREIWVVDFEFYPGPGKANGGGEGDVSTPLCLVARSKCERAESSVYGKMNLARSRHTGSTPALCS